MPAHRPSRAFGAIALAAWMLVSPTLAAAQPAPAPADPPGRVGRLARITGTVSFRTTDQTDWQQATLNYPVTSGQAYWTEPGARADIEIAGSRLVLDQGSELDIETLGDHQVAANLVQGNLALSLRGMEPGDTVTLRTPRGTVTIAQDGSYAVETGDTGRPGTVTVIDGQAQIFGPGLSLAVGPHQTARITGQETLQGSIGPQVTDPFITATTASPPPLPTGTYAPPEQVQEMTGGALLAETGSWETVPEYGQIWYPPVVSGWVPYRHGHWAYVLPWGWTWVDDAPWGFAPFHYGRWLQIGPRWAWAPGPWEGRHHHPIYAPALVAFVGFGAGVAIGARFGSPVGWIPLGPREPYRPSYGASPAYTNRMNFGHGPNMPNSSYINRHATTVVPASAMANSQPVARNTRFVSPQAFGAARPLAQAPVRPTQATAGISPTVGRQLGLPPGPRGVTARPAAPGPNLGVRPGFAGTSAALPVPRARPSMPNIQRPAGPSPGVERPGFTQPSTQQPPAQFRSPLQTAQPPRAFPHIQQPQYQRPAAPAPYPSVRPQYTAPSSQHFAVPQPRAAPSLQTAQPQQHGAPQHHCQQGQRSC